MHNIIFLKQSGKKKNRVFVCLRVEEMLFLVVGRVTSGFLQNRGGHSMHYVIFWIDVDSSSSVLVVWKRGPHRTSKIVGVVM